jgi:olfactory receptor
LLILYLVLFISGTSNEDMEKENATRLTEFVLTGLMQQPEWKCPWVWCSWGYISSPLCQTCCQWDLMGLIADIWNNPPLHISMYLFFGSLSFVDACLSSTVTRKMLVTLLDKSKWSPHVWMPNTTFSFGISATTESFLLAAMSYYRYVAICKSLLYPVITNNWLSICLIVLIFIGGFLNVIIHQYFYSD